MMRAISVVTCVLVCCLVAEAAGAPKEVAVRIAQELSEAVRKGDHARVVSLTYPKLIKVFGGRDKMIAGLVQAKKQWKATGMTLQSVRVGQPTDPLREGKLTFIVVPTRTELTIPNGRIISKSYLLGISPDGGNSWTFVDGAGMEDQKMRRRVLPKLPAKLNLPKNQKPQYLPASHPL